MRGPQHHNTVASYWFRVFAFYALAEACIQLLFFIILNNFGNRPISLIEIHLLMWIFQCLLIAPIWWIAWTVRKKKVIIQVLVNLGFYVIYSYFWFGPVQELIGYLYENLISVTRPASGRIPAILDSGDQYSYINYQLLKHAFRLSWFYLAAYFYNYRLEEAKRLQLAVANRELQLKMLKWHLNPSFYFKTINHLQQVSKDNPGQATVPILQLAKVMEYVIYEAKEKLIDVKKEVQFLSNYTDLINQQNNGVSFSTEVTGDHDQLKIAPLLLAVFVDKLAVDTPASTSTIYRLQLNFSGNELMMLIEGNKPVEIQSLLQPDDDIQQRLMELYRGKFTIKNDTHTFKLQLILDEQ